MALLDNQPQIEKDLNLITECVIVTRKDWLEVRAFLNTDKVKQLFHQYKHSPLGRKDLDNNIETESL